jgi:hypothetical protein
MLEKSITMGIARPSEKYFVWTPTTIIKVCVRKNNISTKVHSLVVVDNVTHAFLSDSNASPFGSCNLLWSSSIVLTLFLHSRRMRDSLSELP